MTANELAAIIGSIDEKYVEEAAVETGGMRRTGIRRRIVIAAVAAAMVTAISATAFAADWFGIRSLLMTGGTVSSDEQDTITLAGYFDTAEYKAASEWHQFLEGYDVMGAVGTGNSIFAPGTSYNFYQVYNQEMADKLDEIVGKYNLKLHTVMIDSLYTEDALCQQVGGDFLGSGNNVGGGYMYEDGTFKYDGTAELEDGTKLEYQFIRSVKGSFTDLTLTLNMGDAAQYRELAYTCADGAHVMLAVGPHRSLVIADSDDCLVTVVVLAGAETPPEAIFSASPLSETTLEMFAESFSFSLLTPVKTPSY